MRRFRNILISVTAALLPLAASASFSDVPTSHPNFSAINYVQLSGIVQGYADGTYGPSKTINRAEFTKILIAARYSPVTITSCTSASFDDTPASEWFSPYVCVAFNQGIIGGYSDGTFKPINNVNMGEAAKIIVRAFDLPPVPTDDPALDLYRSGFAIAGSQDEKLNPYWWQYYLVVLNTAGALPSTYRGPDQPVTRAEMAEMIYRVMNRPGATSSAVSVTPVVPASSSAPIVSSSRASTANSQIPTGQTKLGVDLSIKAGSITSAKKGEPLTVEYTIYNDGPGDADNVQIFGTFSRKPDFDEALSDSRCTATSGTEYSISCSLGTIESGQKTQVAISEKTSRISCPIQLTQSFKVTTKSTEDITYNNSDQTTTDLHCPTSDFVDLTPEVVAPTHLVPNSRGTVTYYIHNNAAEATAYNPAMRITVGPGLTFVPASSPQSCTLQSGTIVCTTANIPGGGSAFVDLAFDVTCVAEKLQTTMAITTTSQNKFALNPLTSDINCY